MAKPAQIVSILDNHTIHLHEEQLERILLADDVKDKPVVVISVMGRARQGKSFLLNYLLRYLRSNGGHGWIGAEDAPLEGFIFSNSQDTVTKGILVWEQPLLVHTTDGNEAVLLLMDTQGAFGKGCPSTVTTSLGALSVMTSSLQIYNVRGNIQEDQLEHLQLVAEYGKALRESENFKPFQKLTYVVRDWQSSGPCGADGGREVLTRFMDTTDSTTLDGNTLRENLASSFSEIDCFLMPHPGKVVAKDTYDGRLRELDDDFKYSLEELMPWLLKEKLEVKKINGNKVTCQQLLNIFKTYAGILREEKLPKLKSEVQRLADETNNMAVQKAKEFYENGMKKATYNTLEEVKKNHIELFPQARKMFLNTPKIDYYVSKRYFDTLKKEIIVIYQKFAWEKYEEFNAINRRNTWITAIGAGVALPVAAALMSFPAVAATIAGVAAGNLVGFGVTMAKTPMPMQHTEAELNAEPEPEAGQEEEPEAQPKQDN